LRGRSVDFNPEEEEAKKKAKMEQRRKKMWKANGYISSSIIATRWVEEADKAEAAEEEPEPEAAAAAPKLAVQWVCGSCTFVNPKENDKCEMCDAERTLASASSKGKEKSEVRTAPPLHCTLRRGTTRHGGYTIAGANSFHYLMVMLYVHRKRRRSRSSQTWTRRGARRTTFTSSWETSPSLCPASNGPTRTPLLWPALMIAGRGAMEVQLFSWQAARSVGS
jgi:hypothetical protein